MGITPDAGGAGAAQRCLSIRLLSAGRTVLLIHSGGSDTH